MNNNIQYSGPNPTPNMPPDYGAYYQPPVDYGAPISATANKIGISLVVSIVSNFIVSFIAIFVVMLVNWDLNSILSGDMSALDILIDQTSLPGQIFSTIVYLAMFVPAIFICVKLLKIPTKVAFPIRKAPTDVMLSSVGFIMGASVIGSIVVAIIYAAMVFLTGYGPVYPLDYVPRDLAPTILFFINIAILPAILEEFLFRGVIMQSLRRFGDGFALITSSILFGLAHGNLIQAPNAFILGLVMGYFALYSGSLVPAMVMHFTNNATAAIFMIATRNTTTSQDEMFNVVFLLARVLIGIIALVYFKSKQGRLFHMPASNYPLKESTKYSKYFLTLATTIYLLVILFLTISNLEPVDPSTLLQ